MSTIATVNRLERAALAAHAAGHTWTTFWGQHGAAICAAEPRDRQRFARLVRRLLSLVASGDTDGQQAVGDDDAMPGELDDQPSPDDTRTAAKCLQASTANVERPA